MVTMQLIIAPSWKTSRTAVSSADTKQLASSSLCCHSMPQKQGWEPGAAGFSSSTLMRGWSTSTKVLMFVCLSVTQQDYRGGTGLVFILWKMWHYKELIKEASAIKQSHLLLHLHYVVLFQGNLSWAVNGKSNYKSENRKERGRVLKRKRYLLKWLLSEERTFSQLQQQPSRQRLSHNNPTDMWQ